MFDSYPRWLVNPKFPWPLLAPEPWGFFWWEKHHGRFWGFFCEPLGWTAKNPGKKFPTKTREIIQDFRRSCCIYVDTSRKAQTLIFRPRNWAVLQKHCKLSITTCNRKFSEPESWESLKIPHFSWKNWDPPKMNPGFLLKALLLESQTTNQPKPTINR